jgi:ribosomal protein L3
LKVIRIDKDKNLLMLRGAVPGAVGVAVTLHRSKGATPSAKN